MIPKANIEEMQMKSRTSKITKEATRDFFLETNAFTLQKAVITIKDLVMWVTGNSPPISSAKK